MLALWARTLESLARTRPLRDVPAAVTSARAEGASRHRLVPCTRIGRSTLSAAATVTAIAVVALACACGGPDSSKSPRVVRLFDDLSEARFHAADGPLRRTRLLFDSRAASEDAWGFVTRIGVPPVDHATARRLGLARVEPDGRVILESDHVAAIRLIELPGDTSRVELRGRLSVSAEPGAGGYGRVCLLELRSTVLPDTRELLARDQIALHSSAPCSDTGNESEDVFVAADTAPDARAVLVVCEHIAQEPGSRSTTLFDVSVSSPGPAESAAAVAEDGDLQPWPPGSVDADDAARPRQARFCVDLVHRFGVALPHGAELRVPVPAPEGRRRFTCSVAVLGREQAGTCTFVAEWIADDGTHDRIASLDVELEPDDSDATAPSRWHTLRAELPGAGLEGGVLTLAAVADPPLSEHAIPVFAGAILSDARSRSEKTPNLLLLSLDTVRADRCGARRNGRAITPNLDRLAARSIAFTQAWSASSYTLPSHVSLFSGQEPTVHGVQQPNQRRDRARTPMLAEWLATRGYRTAAFTAGGFVEPRHGFAAGFERYGTLDPAAHRESARVQLVATTLAGSSTRVFVDTGIDAISAQLDEFEGQPWFLFVHTYAAHEFDPPDRCMAALGVELEPNGQDQRLRAHLHSTRQPPRADLERLAELYDASVYQADELLGSVLDLLDDSDDTLIAVTSDHGKELGERVGIGHGHTLFEELLHVPLVIHVPGLEPRRVARPVAAVDLLPTLLAALGIPSPEASRGRDLLLDTGQPARDEAKDEGEHVWAEVDNLVRMQALRIGGSKVVHTLGPEPAWARYDLDADPSEARPAAVDESLRARLLAHRSELVRARDGLDSEVDARLRLDDEAVRTLELLGYSGGAR